ncbi:MAG: hypothetical protein ABR956_11280 [Terracidiphilus sp.]
MGYDLDGITGGADGIARDILRGDLESVETEAGAARVELGRDEGVEDPGKGMLDGATVFEDGELQVPIGV